MSTLVFAGELTRFTSANVRSRLKITSIQRATELIKTIGSIMNLLKGYRLVESLSKPNQSRNHRNMRTKFVKFVKTTTKVVAIGSSIIRSIVGKFTAP